MPETRSMANGNGVAVRSAKTAPEEEEKENIFMFYPNLIGMFRLWTAVPHLTGPRLLPRRPRHSLPLLHAPPPAHMLAPL